MSNRDNAEIYARSALARLIEKYPDEFTEGFSDGQEGRVTFDNDPEAPDARAYAAGWTLGEVDAEIVRDEQARYAAAVADEEARALAGTPD